MKKHSIAAIFRNTALSLAILCLASLAFVCIISLFPLIGSLTLDHFPIKQVVTDNFMLLPPLMLVSLLISPLLGWGSMRFANKRFLKLLLIALPGNWLAIVLVMLVWSNLAIKVSDIFAYLFLSVWALLAYSFYSLPVIAIAVLLIERWTRRSAKEVK